jgi:hypothetical protein
MTSQCEVRGEENQPRKRDVDAEYEVAAHALLVKHRLSPICQSKCRQTSEDQLSNEQYALAALPA